ncbi:MAG TPA: tripartite tricarboxylate transporter substrate binding protein [Burkholderiales bacterium]|nr:tripartite tricarboxylate transporter substrate binding protein [Burkholderiales bacterium]
MWKAVLYFVCCCYFPAAISQAYAQAFPSRPIRIVVPYAPGGTTDIVGRQMGQRLSEALGQPVVIENRSGGNTAIGADAVAKAAPDGHTLLFTNDATFVLNPVLFASLPYNVSKDFVPVATVTYVALALVVNSSVPVNSFKELVAYTQAKRGSLSYGSFGAGSQPHVMGEMYKKLTGTDLVHVPYKGAGPAVADVLGGQILFTFPAFPTIQGHLKSGKLKVLAVSGDKRVPLAPDVPTFTEAGYPGMDVGAWYAFLAPAGTPKDVVAKLNSTVNGILKDREFVEKNMTSQGMAPMALSPDEFAELIRKETARMTKIVKESGAKAE